jgi:hypothetical protein
MLIVNRQEPGIRHGRAIVLKGHTYRLDVVWYRRLWAWVTRSNPKVARNKKLS